MRRTQRWQHQLLVRMWVQEISFNEDRNTNGTTPWEDNLARFLWAKYSVSIQGINCVPALAQLVWKHTHPCEKNKTKTLRKYIKQFYSQGQNLGGPKMTYNRWKTTKRGTMGGGISEAHKGGRHRGRKHRAQTGSIGTGKGNTGCLDGLVAERM